MCVVVMLYCIMWNKGGKIMNRMIKTVVYGVAIAGVSAGVASADSGHVNCNKGDCDISNVTNLTIEMANVIEREDEIMARCLLVAATLHTGSGRDRVSRGVITRPLIDPQFLTTLGDCINIFPESEVE